MPSLVILAGVLILLVVVAAVWLLRVRARAASASVGGHHEDEQLPFLVVPPGLAARAAQAPAPEPPAPPVPTATAPTVAGARSNVAEPVASEAAASKGTPQKPAVPAAAPARPRGSPRGGSAPVPPRPAASPPAEPPVRPVPQTEIVPAATGEEDDGTLQLLPGRLEVLSGGNGTQEIRFVRIPGQDPEVTIGRGRGEPHRHVRLDVPTVSRVHVALHFAEGRWSIENRSDTNPAVVRGAPLTVGERLTLSDGDLVELGEVVMRFRS